MRLISSRREKVIVFVQEPRFSNRQMQNIFSPSLRDKSFNDCNCTREQRVIHCGITPYMACGRAKWRRACKMWYVSFLILGVNCIPYYNTHTSHAASKAFAIAKVSGANNNFLTAIQQTYIRTVHRSIVTASLDNSEMFIFQRQFQTSKVVTLSHKRFLIHHHYFFFDSPTFSTTYLDKPKKFVLFATPRPDNNTFPLQQIFDRYRVWHPFIMKNN